MTAIPYPVQYPSLTFNFNSYSVTLLEPEIISYRRTKVSTLAVTRANMGQRVFSGNSYYPYAEIILSLMPNTEEQSDLLEAIYNASINAATTPPRTGFTIFLSDICQPLTEEVQTVENALPLWTDTVGASTKYFGKFEGIITDYSSVPNGVGYVHDLTFVQTVQL